MRWSAVMLLCFAAMFTIGQCAQAQENWLQADFRREKERMADACKGFNANAIQECAIGLFTDHPLHVAAGSMPPQNGFGLGAAFVAARNTRNWRMSWDTDAVGAFSGAWRAGAYMKLIHTPQEPIHLVTPTAPGSGGQPSQPKRPSLTIHPYTVFNLYAQTISLNKLNYFGEGNDSALAGASLFGMRETFVGGSVIKPVYEFPSISKLNLSLIGQVNGRFVKIRSENGQSTPSIETLYNNLTAPGLASQPGFLQFSQGLRIKPLFADRFELNYMAGLEEFVAPSDSNSSFERWTLDLNHTFYLYGFTETGSPSRSTEQNGPDSCSHGDEKCPAISRSRNLSGSLGFHLLLSESMNSATAVPFYFQQTLGGSDINSTMSLGSYQDYRFRAPNLLLLQETFEHSVWGPFGVKVMADQGRVAINRSDLGFDHLRHSYAAGLTLRAGGFPMVSLMFAWGGPEGHHNIVNMNSSLLGGSGRPPLD